MLLNPFRFGGFGSTSVEFVGASSGSSNNLSFGGITVLEGDLIYYVLLNQASDIIPSIPLGYTSLYSTTDAVPTSPTMHGLREVWKIAGSSESAPGVVSSAPRWLLAVFRNTHQTDPFGASGLSEAAIASTGGGATTFAFPSLDFEVENNTSQVACMLFAPSIGTNNSVDLNALPSDLTERRRISGSNTLYGVGTSGPQNAYAGGSSGSSVDRPGSGTFYMWLRSREILAA